MAGIAGLLIAIFLIRALGGSIRVPTVVWVYIAKIALLGFTAAIISEADIGAVAGTVVVAAEIALVWMPTAVLRSTIVPLRMPRFAYWTVMICWPLGLVKEVGAGGVIYGALALARQDASHKAIPWLERKLDRVTPIRGVGVVAAGLLAALRGQGERARQLFAIADKMNARLIPSGVRAIARDWLVADAARAGKWRKVIRLGRHGAKRLRWSYSMARIAERLTEDHGACRDWQLWLYFLIAPRRRVTYPLLRRALAVPARQMAQPDATPPVVHPDLPHALGLLADVIGRMHAQDGEALARSIGAVEEQLLSMRDQIERRLNALGSRSDAGAILSAFRQRLIDLATPLIEGDFSLAGRAQPGSIMDEAQERVRRRLFDDIEALCRDYRERTMEESSLDLVAEWQAWAALRITAEQILELDPGASNALFHTVYASVCNFAVFQHNNRNRIVLAHDMFTWLLRHSQSDTEASQLLVRNVKAGISGI
jgi:hypothetical protein